jgi:hypothetical protein
MRLKRSSAISTRSMRSQMTNPPTDKEKYEMIEEACRKLAAEGRIYDTGQRKWSERTKSYQIVWGVVPPKQKQS